MSSALEALHRLSLSLGTSLDRSQECSVFVEWLKAEIQPRLTALFVADRRRENLQLVASSGFKKPRSASLPVGHDPWDWMKTQKVSLPAGERYSLPIILEGELFGLLLVVSAKENETLHEEQRLLNLALAYLAPILRNIERYQSIEQLVEERTFQLRESEERYRNLVNSLPVLIYALSAEGNITFLNPVFEQITGWPVEAWLGRSFEDLIHPEDRPLIQERFARALKTTHTQKTIEVRLRTASGEPRIVEIMGVAQIKQDQVVGVTGYAHDITEHKKAEEALRASEERFRTLAESTSTAIFVYSGEHFIYVNRATEELTGYSAAELLGLHFWDVVHPDFQEIIRQRGLARQRGENVPSRYEFKIIRKDGQERWIDFTAGKIEWHGQSAAIGSAFDVTARKQAEEALRTSEERFRTYLERASDYIFTLDPQGKITFVNQAMCEALGCEETELLGQSALNLVSPEARQQAAQTLERIWQGETVASIVLPIQTRHGKKIITEIRGRSIYEGDRLVETLHIARDMTIQKEAEEAIKRSERRLLALIENGLDYISLLDAEGKLLWESPSTTSMLNYDYNAYVGRNIFELVHPDSVDWVRQQFAEVVSQPGSRRSAVFRLHRADGSWRWVESIATNFLHDPAVGAIVVNYRDITERKQAEDALRQSEEKYRTLIEQIPAIVYVDKLDEKGTTLFVSPQVETMLGISVEEWLQGDLSFWLNLIHPEDRSYVETAYQETINTGKHADIEYRIISRDGKQLWIHDKAQILKDENGNTFLHGVMFDITEQKRHEREIQAEAMLTQALGETLDLQAVLERLLAAARHAIPAAEKGSILLVDADGELRIHAVNGYLDPRIRNFTFAKNSGYSARAARERRPLIIHDARSDPEIRYEGEIEVARQIQSAIVAPLILQERLIGVISLDSTRKNAFTEEDLALLTTFAGPATLIIENARLFEETRRHAKETTSLLEASLALSSLDLQTTLQTIGERAKALFQADGCRVFLLEPDGRTLRCVLALQENQAAFVGLTIPLGQGVTGQVALSGQAEIVNDMLHDPRAVPVPGTGEEAEAIMFAPLKEGDHTIGVISIRRIGTERPFQPHDLELLEAFASMAASAVFNARLYEETQKRLAELSALHHSSQQLLRAGMDAEQIYAIIHEAVKHVMPCDAFVIVLEEQPGGDYQAVYRYDLNQRYPPLHIRRGEGLSGRVISAGETIFVPDVLAEKDLKPIHFGQPQSVRSILAVPVRRGEQIFGMISAQSYQPAAYNEHHRGILETIAAQFSTAIENARLFQEIQQRLSELETLQTVSAALRRARTVEEMLPIFVRYAAQAVGAKAGSIYLLDEASGDWVSQGWVTDEGKWLTTPAEMRHHPGEGVTGLVGETGTLYITQDWRDDPINSPLPGELNFLQNFYSGISLPLPAEARIIGVMHIWYDTIHQFSENEKRLLTAIADMAGSAIQRARLHQETERRVEQLQSLQAIDQAITASMDPRVSLNILLEHTIHHLGIDAAGVLLMNPTTHQLEYAAGRGFHTHYYERSALRIGEGGAGRAALERRILVLPSIDPTLVSRSELFKREGFASYLAAPLLAKGQVKGVLEVFHRTPYSPTIENLRFFENLAQQAAIAIDNAQLFENLQRSNLELSLAYEKTIEGWSRALDLRDKETEGHTQRVTALTVELAQAMGLNEEQIVHIRRGALLHDIGKMGIPDHILFKEGALTPEEWAIMRQHPQYAYEMLAAIDYLRPSIDIPWCHHEKWDGSGYPRGLKGEQIPLAARIFAVADVFDALTSNRPYRKAWTTEQALQYIKEQAGSHFDPQVVEIFLKLNRAT